MGSGDVLTAQAGRLDSGRLDSGRLENLGRPISDLDSYLPVLKKHYRGPCLAGSSFREKLGQSLKTWQKPKSLGMELSELGARLSDNTLPSRGCLARGCLARGYDRSGALPISVKLLPESHSFRPCHSLPSLIPGIGPYIPLINLT